MSTRKEDVGQKQQRQQNMSPLEKLFDDGLRIGPEEERFNYFPPLHGPTIEHGPHGTHPTKHDFAEQRPREGQQQIRQAFLVACVQGYTQESIQFLTQVHALLKNKQEQQLSPEEEDRLTLDLYNRFLANQTVNVDTHAKSEIARKQTEGLKLTVDDLFQAVKEVMQLMRQDAVGRFNVTSAPVEHSPGRSRAKTSDHAPAQPGTAPGSSDSKQGYRKKTEQQEHHGHTHQHASVRPRHVRRGLSSPFYQQARANLARALDGKQDPEHPDQHPKPKPKSTPN